MASWSRLLVPIGRSWCIFVLVFAAVLLRWREQSQAVELWRSISDNKAVLSFLSSLLVLLYERGTGQWWSVCGKLPWRKMCRTPPAASSSNKHLLLQIGELLSHLLRSAGRGGEGEVKGRHQLVRSGGEKGCLACPGKSPSRICSQMRPSRVCGTAILAFLSVVLQWMEPYAEDGGVASSFPHKLEERLPVLGVVVCLCRVELELVCSCSRCRGDRRGGAAASFSLFDADTLPELVCVAMHASGAVHRDPKLRPSSANAIHGEGRRSVLWSVFQRYFFLLCWRIFDLGEGISGAVVPSGLFPGDDGDALALRSMAVGGEDEGLDCILCFSSEVLFVISEDATVIFLLSGVLLVILYLPR